MPHWEGRVEILQQELTTKTKSSNIGYLYALITAVSGATSGILGKYAYAAGVDTHTLVLGRGLFAFIIIAGFLCINRRDEIKIDYRHIPFFILSGVFGLAAIFVCYLSGIKYMSIAAITVLLYTNPIIVCLISAFLFNERIDTVKLLALLLTIAGCFFAVGAYNPEALNLNLIGTLLGFGSAIGMVIYSIYSKILLKSYSNFTIYFWSFLFASIAIFLFNPISLIKLISLPLKAKFIVFLAAFVPTLMTYGFYTMAVNEIGPSKAAITCTLEPAIAAIFSYFLFGEYLELIQWLGIIAVILGISLLHMPQYFTRIETESVTTDGQAKN